MLRVETHGDDGRSARRFAGPAFRAAGLCLAMLAVTFVHTAARPADHSFPASRGTASDTLTEPSRRPTVLKIHPDLLLRLQVLADALHKEIVLCLHGAVVGDTATVARLEMPDPEHSGRNSARFGPCRPDALAVWHNHPVPPPGVRAPRAVTGNGPVGLCRLSDTDAQTTARAGHPFTVVSVDAATLCWWTLEEVRSLARR